MNMKNTPLKSQIPTRASSRLRRNQSNMVGANVKEGKFFKSLLRSRIRRTRVILPFYSVFHNLKSFCLT